MEQWDRNDKLKHNKSLQRLKMKTAYGTMGQKWQTKTQQEFTKASWKMRPTKRELYSGCRDVQYSAYFLTAQFFHAKKQIANLCSFTSHLPISRNNSRNFKVSQLIASTHQAEHWRKEHPADPEPRVDAESNHVSHVVIETLATWSRGQNEFGLSHQQNSHTHYH